MLRTKVSEFVIRVAALCGAGVGALLLFWAAMWACDRFSATGIAIVLMSLGFAATVIRLQMLVRERLVALEHDLSNQRHCIAAVNSAIDHIETALEKNVWFQASPKEKHP